MTTPNLTLAEAQKAMRKRLHEGRWPKKRIRHRVIPNLITFLPRPETITQDIRTLPYTATYTEFELQADTWWRLNGDGFYTRGEVDSGTGRLDLVVYYNPQVYLPLAVIEAKRKRHMAWELSVQGKNYLKLGVPVILYWRYEQYEMLVRRLMRFRKAAQSDHRYTGEAPHLPAFSHAPVGLLEIVQAASEWAVEGTGWGIRQDSLTDLLDSDDLNPTREEVGTGWIKET
jgi:hypothetical protein